MTGDLMRNFVMQGVEDGCFRISFCYEKTYPFPVYPRFPSTKVIDGKSERNLFPDIIFTFIVEMETIIDIGWYL